MSNPHDPSTAGLHVNHSRLNAGGAVECQAEVLPGEWLFEKQRGRLST